MNYGKHTNRGRYVREDVEIRFWDKVRVGDGCWEWTSALDGHGYARFTIDGKQRQSHRVAWFITHGEWPPAGMDLCHRCDNRLCVRPGHMFLGTRADNMRDCVAKNRIVKSTGDNNGTRRKPETRPRGERVHTAKLDAEKVAEIVRMARAGITQRAIAERFGVAHCTIGAVLRGEFWRHVDRPQ